MILKRSVFVSPATKATTIALCVSDFWAQFYAKIGCCATVSLTVNLLNTKTVHLHSPHCCIVDYFLC